MAGTAVNSKTCFRIPAGVDFLRWAGEEDWVLYHTGTGETLRLSDLALAILDLLGHRAALDRDELACGLAALFDEPLEDAELQAGLEEHMRLLLAHECIEPVSCA